MMNNSTRKNFKGATAAITGAASGMGRALAVELAKMGCNVALCDIQAQELAQTAKMVGEYGVGCTTTVLDISDKKAVHDWADATGKTFKSVNMVFNNAGVALSGTVSSVSYDELEWILGINMWGVIYGTKAFLPLLEQAPWGHVVNVSSVFGLIGVPTMAPYNTSKFAVRGFTECLRLELKIENSTVSATSVHPGGIKTNIARDSRISSNMNGIWATDPDQSKRDFEKMFSTSPQIAAQEMIKAIQKDQARLLIGKDATAIDWIARHLPVNYQRMLTTMARRFFASSP